MAVAIENQLSTGAYSVAEATLYIRATMEGRQWLPTTRHLHWWIRQGLGGGTRRDEEPSGCLVNFLELISFGVVATMRAKGIPGPEIQNASKELRARLGWDYPFAMKSLWLHLVDVFASEVLVSSERKSDAVNRCWLDTLELLEKYPTLLHGLSFDHSNQAKSWTPADGILLDPKIQFGEPCIAGTRIPTETIWAFFSAGDKVETIARMYYLPIEKVQAAISWERRLARPAC